MELERPEIVVTPEYISSDVSNNHLAYKSGSLRRSSQGSISIDAQTVASENECQNSAGLEDVERADEKEIVDVATIVEEDRLHEAVKSTASLGSKASHNLPDKDGETNAASKLINENDSNTKTVKKRNKKLKKRIEKRTTLDGRKVVYATECTQTDWKWKDKAEKSGKGTVLSSVLSSSVAPSPSGEKVTSAGSRSASLKSAQAKSDSIQSMGQTQEELESKGEIVTVTDLTPFFLVPDDEFGIPIVEMSSDSDTSNEESYERPKHYRHYLPSIGPPQILRYIRESEILEKTGDKAHKDWNYVQVEASSETPAFEEHDSPLGMFTGPCEFCGVDIKPFPSLDQQLSEPPESLYCCEEYREFVEFATTTAVRMEDEVTKDQQQISVKVHPHHGSAHDRHLAKEKAVQRMHEREILRRQQEASGLQAVFHQNSQMHNEVLGSGDVISNEDYSVLQDGGMEKVVLGSVVQKRKTVNKIEGGTVNEGRTLTDAAESLVSDRKEPGKDRQGGKGKRRGFSGLVKDISHEQNAGKGNSRDFGVHVKDISHEQNAGKGNSRDFGGHVKDISHEQNAGKGNSRDFGGHVKDISHEQNAGKGNSRDFGVHVKDSSYEQNAGKGNRRGFGAHVKDSSHDQNAGKADSHYRRITGRGTLRGFVPGGPQTHHFSLGMPAGSRSLPSSFGPLNIEVARQMKTINYQLSSQRCLEEGWTLRAPSPMVMDDAESEMFVLEPLHPAMIATGKLQGRPLIEKFYQNGSKFLTIFPDGTGNVLYPSGRVAILISSIALGQNTYVVQDDCDEPVLLGVFQPNGYGCCCFANSKVRLTYDPLEGLELDYTGTRKRVWSWKDQEVHIHAPPFQPIVFAMNSYLGIRFMAQENIALTFTGRKRSCRFNVGVKLKMVTPDNFQPKCIQEDELLIREHKIRVETILNKVSNLLKFPKSPKVDRILPPLSVSGRRQRMEKLKQASLSSHQTQKPFKQTKLPPLDSAAVSVN